jgi:hypothetical protein
LNLPQKHTWIGSGAVVLAALEAACVFFVGASSAALLSGGVALGALKALDAVHASWIRVPVLFVAAGAALLNLWVLARRWRLRSSPAAQWRIQPLTRGEKLRIALILSMSVLTLALVAAELFLHHKLHGSAFS